MSVEWSALGGALLSSMVELRRRRRVGRVLLGRRGLELEEVLVPVVVVVVVVPQGSSGAMAPGRVPARNGPGASQMARGGWFRW